MVRALQDSDRDYKYDMLAKTYIYDVLLHFALESYIRVAPYSIANGGVFKHLPEDAETVFEGEINRLAQNEAYKAQDFADRLINHLDMYGDHYPEYDEMISEGLRASKRSRFAAGWVFGDASSCGNYNTKVDPDFFTVDFWYGTNNSSAIGFDPDTLETKLSIIPNSVFAQPDAEYFWMVSTTDFKISQLGTDIPLGPFASVNEFTEVYVKGEDSGKFWVRIKIADTYEDAVQFTINKI